MQQFYKILKIDVVNLCLEPAFVFFSIGFPVAGALILGFLSSGSYGNTVSSYDYYGVAVLFFGVSNAATFSANSFMEEKIKSANMRIIYSPVPKICIYLSKVAAAFIFCSLSCVISAVILHLLLKVNYGGSLAWGPFVVMLCSVFFFSAIGVLVCCFFKSESITNQIISPIIALLCLIGGVFFPIEGFGKWVVLASWLSPVKWMLTSCAEIIYDRNFTLFLPTVGILTGLSILAILISSKLFKGEDYL